MLLVFTLNIMALVNDFCSEVITHYKTMAWLKSPATIKDDKLNNRQLQERRQLKVKRKLSPFQPSGGVELQTSDVMKTMLSRRLLKYKNIA